jgi:hypothetical protein
LVETVSGLKAPAAKSNLDIYPNPNATSTLSLNGAKDVAIFNIGGQLVLQSANSIQVNISSLKPGVYMVKDKVGNVNKLIRK